MNSDERINELLERQAKVYEKTSIARKRIEAVLDPQSFVDIGFFAEEVLTGYGTVNGRLCYIYSQNPDCMGGAVGESSAKKISQLYSLALKMGAPIIGILDSKGMKLGEGMDALSAYGEIYASMSRASGVVPQITVVAGNCLGGAVFIAQLSDFVFMHKGSKLFINSPQTMDIPSNKQPNNEQIQEEDAVLAADYMADTLEEIYPRLADLFSFLPSNNMEEAYLSIMEDDLNRTDEVLNSLIKNRDSMYDIKELISVIADRNQFMEIKKNSGKGIVTGFASFNGYSVGIVANNNSYESKLGAGAVKKASAFVKFCDSFNIPLLTLTDTTGFTHSFNEAKGLSMNVAELIHAFVSATVPKVNVIVKSAFGSAYLAFNSRAIGADIVYAWVTSVIGVADTKAAVSVLYPQMWTIGETDKETAMDKYDSELASPYDAVAKGYVNDVILPSHTRKYIVSAFEMLSGKRVTAVSRKRSSL